MRLVNPGLGDLLDRLTVLELKLAHGGETHFQEEAAAIVMLLDKPLAQAAISAGAGGMAALVCRLAAINGSLWQAEDELRLERDKPRLSGGAAGVDLAASGRLAHQIQLLNDKRAAVVRELSRLAWGQDWKEKLS